MKVQDLIGNYTDPRGEAGRDVPTELAEAMASDMRLLLESDLDEVSMSHQVRIYSRNMDQDLFVAAWEFLNAMERRAWRAYVSYEEWLKLEWVRVEGRDGSH